MRTPFWKFRIYVVIQRVTPEILTIGSPLLSGNKRLIISDSWNPNHQLSIHQWTKRKEICAFDQCGCRTNEQWATQDLYQLMDPRWTLQSWVAPLAYKNSHGVAGISQADTVETCGTIATLRDSIRLSSLADNRLACPCCRDNLAPRIRQE